MVAEGETDEEAPAAGADGSGAGADTAVSLLGFLSGDVNVAPATVRHSERGWQIADGQGTDSGERECGGTQALPMIETDAAAYGAGGVNMSSSDDDSVTPQPADSAQQITCRRSVSRAALAG